MPINPSEQPQNTSDYIHPRDPHLHRIENAMQYNGSGEPVVRTHVDGITLEGDVIVDAVKLWDGTDTLEFEAPNNDGEAGQAALPAEAYNMVFNGSTWDRMRGNIADGVLAQISNDYLAISKDTNANSDSNRIYVNATGTVSLAAGTTVDVGNFPAFPTSFTANQGTAGASAWKVDIGTNGTVSLAAGTTVNISDNGGSITVDGSVSITGPVEIKNDIDNPIPISANTSVNSSGNPIYTSTNISGGTVTVVPSAVSGDYFNEPYSIPITPVVQTDGRYGTNTLDHQIYTALSGAVDHSGGAFTVSCSSTTGSYALLRSRRFNTFKPGQSFMARWFAKFDTPTANTSQRLGVQNQENGYYLGYNGTTFSVLHVHDSRAPIHKITVNSYTGTQTVTITLNSVPYTVTIQTGETIGQAAHRISKANFGGLWLASDVDNTVELLYTGVGPLGGTFSIAGSGTFSGTVTQDQAGVAATNTWKTVTKPAWLEPTRYNQYQVKYSWAGVDFYAINPTTGDYEVFYQLNWAGSSDATELPVTNPAFKIAALALNQGSATGVTVRVATMMMALEGITNRNSYTGSIATTKTSLTQNDLHHLVSIKNPYTWSQCINTIETLLNDFVATTQCNDPTEVYMYVDAELLTGTHDFVSQDSLPVTISTVVGTLNYGTNFPILAFVVGNTGSSVQFALEAYRVVVPPGSSVTIAIRSTATIQKAAASLTWYND